MRQVTKLCEFPPGPAPGGDSVCSVSWSQRGTYLSVGTNSGAVQIWDVAKVKMYAPSQPQQPHTSANTRIVPAAHGVKTEHAMRRRAVQPEDNDVLYGRVRTMSGHRGRVGTMAWSSHLLSSGSRDRNILQRDIRAPEDFQHKLLGHRSEVIPLCHVHEELCIAHSILHHASVCHFLIPSRGDVIACCS